MKKIISYLGVSLLLAGCTDSVSEIPTINVEIKSSPVREEVPVESLGGSVEVIPLETSDSCLLSKVEQLVDRDFLWIVSDKQIYKFGKDGKFIGKIGKVGQGPEEYVAPQQILVDGKEKRLFVLDYFGRKTLVLDYEGNVLKSFGLPQDYSLNKIAFVDNELLYTSMNNSVKPDLFVCNLETQQMDTLSFRERTMGMEGFLGETYIYPLKGKTYLYHYFNDTVYAYSNKKLTPAYVFNLNGYKYQFEELEIVADYTPKKPIDGPRMQLSNFVELEDFLFVPYTVAVPHRKLDEADTRLLIYDKKDKTLYADAQLVCTDTPALSLKKFDPLILSTDQKSFYTYKQAEDLADENLVEGLGPDDNPVLIKYSFQ